MRSCTVITLSLLVKSLLVKMLAPVRDTACSTIVGHSKSQSTCNFISYSPASLASVHLPSRCTLASWWPSRYQSSSTMVQACLLPRTVCCLNGWDNTMQNKAFIYSLKRHKMHYNSFIAFELATILEGTLICGQTEAVQWLGRILSTIVRARIYLSFCSWMLCNCPCIRSSRVLTN